MTLPARCPSLTRFRTTNLLLWWRFGGGLGDIRRDAAPAEIRRLVIVGYIDTRRERDGSVTCRITREGSRFVDRRLGKDARAKREAGLALAGKDLALRT